MRQGFQLEGFPLTYHVVFRIRRVYYDQIVAGTKTVEVREHKPYWATIAVNALDHLSEGTEVVAVFLCGKDVHRRELVKVAWYRTPQEVLGRKLSEQAKRDVGTGRVIGFHVGEVAPTSSDRTSAGS